MSTSGNRFSRMSSGVAANGVMQAAQLFIRLVEVPILLGSWGAVGYGEWLLVVTLPVVLSLSDGGFTKAAQREMTMRAGREDWLGVRKAFQSAWVMLVLLSVAVMALVGLVIPILPLAAWLKITTASSQDLVVVLFAFTAQVLIHFQCGLLHGAFSSHGKYATGVLFIAVTSLTTFTGMIVGVISGGGMPAAACGSLLGQITGYCLMFVASVRANVWPGYGVQSVNRSDIKLMWVPSVANLAFPVADALNVQGLRVVIGLMLGPVALAIFSTTRTLCRVALQPVLSIARTLEPELSLAYGSERQIEARNLFVRSSHIGFWLSISLGLVVLIVGPIFYQFWAGEQLQLSLSAFIIMLVTSVISVLWGIALTIPCSINKHAPLALPFVATYGLAPTLIVFILSKAGGGVAGAALGVFFGDVLTLGLVSAIALKVGGITFSEWIRATICSPITEITNLLVRLKHR